MTMQWHDSEGLRDASCQTDYTSDRELNSRCPSLSDEVYIEKVSLPRQKRQEICWKHGPVDFKNSPRFRNGLLYFTTEMCMACRTESNQRLDLKLRRIASLGKKVVLDPPKATVNICPINLLRETIPNCSDVWLEEQTFFLGSTGSGCLNKNSNCDPPIPPSVSRKMQRKAATGSIPWQDSDLLKIRSTKRHSRCSKVLLKDSSPKSGYRDWILVQQLKSITRDPTHPTMYYQCGRPEFLYCRQETRTLLQLEDISCQHFLLMDRDEALEKGHRVELLFSCQGPLIRDDKHLKGRSIFYFCCEDRRTVLDGKDLRFDQKASASDTNSLEKNIVTDAIEQSKVNQASYDLSHVSITPDEISYSSMQPTSSANTDHHYHHNNWKPGKKRRHKKAQKEDNMLRTVSSSDEEKSKKTVTFSKEIKRRSINKGQELDSEEVTNAPHPEVILADENDNENDLDQKKRQTSQKPWKRNEVPMLNRSVTKVSSYHRVECKAVSITVSFKNLEFVREFSVNKSLQDIYTWLRQQLLKEEALNPGSDFFIMSTSDNLSFPLRANTATRTLSSLPCTSFDCKEVIKGGQGGHTRSVTSKYDTRFAIPLDLRNLEGLTPSQYLSKYCIVSNTWRAFYRNIFSSYDRKKTKYVNLFKSSNRKLEVRIMLELLQVEKYRYAVFCRNVYVTTCSLTATNTHITVSLFLHPTCISVKSG